MVNDKGSALSLTELFTDSFFEEIDKRKQKPGADPTEWRAGGRASKAWPDKEDSTWWMDAGPKMLENWQTWWEGAKEDGLQLWVTPTGLPAIELGLNVNLGGKLLKCYVDAVFVDPDGDLLAVDWKTGREPVAPMQLGFYARAIEGTFKGVQVKYGAYYLARKGDLSHVYDLSVYTPQKVGQWMDRAARMESQGLFIPHPSSLCSACGVKDFCDVMGGTRANEVPDF